MNIISLLLRKVLLFPHYTDGESEAQYDEVAYLRLGSQQEGESGLEPRLRHNKYALRVIVCLYLCVSPVVSPVRLGIN